MINPESVGRFRTHDTSATSDASAGSSYSNSTYQVQQIAYWGSASLPCRPITHSVCLQRLFSQALKQQMDRVVGRPTSGIALDDSRGSIGTLKGKRRVYVCVYMCGANS